MDQFKVNREGSLSIDEIKETIDEGISSRLIEGKRILVITPDCTRTAPLPLMVRTINEVFGARVKRIDFLVALGSHKLLSQEDLFRLYGVEKVERENLFKKSDFFNHRWDLPDTLMKIGRLESQEIKRITGGLFDEGIDIEINRTIYDYDIIIILGTVFPHEVVGFSGGYKYFFPGISGGDFLHFFHWLGAVHTCIKIIGKKDTPVRRVLNAASRFVKMECRCISMVVTKKNDLCGLFVGSPEESWSRAADLSSEIHVVRKQKPYNLIVGSAPRMYDEVWTAGKVMYKLEPVVANCGTLIIYGKHIQSISHTWGKYIQNIGYHVKDYFLSQMDRFNSIPRAVLAHSTHVKGLGTYSGGKEESRIDVVLATSIPEKVCKKINLGYMNPEDIHVDEYRNREDEGILFVEEAGETLYRLAVDGV